MVARLPCHPLTYICHSAKWVQAYMRGRILSVAPTRLLWHYRIPLAFQLDDTPIHVSYMKNWRNTKPKYAIPWAVELGPW